MLLPILGILSALAVAGAAYLYFEGLGARGRWLAALRGGTGSLLVLLILDLTCARSGDAGRPIVLLDGSLSMQAVGGAGAAASDSARAWGEVRHFGADPTGPDSAPGFGRSPLAPRLIAAAALERPVVIVTDGAIDDLDAVPKDLLDRASVRILPRATIADLAVLRVLAADRVTLGDTLRLDVTLGRYGTVGDSAVVEAVVGERVLATRRLRLGPTGGHLVLPVESRGLGAGDHLIDVRVRGRGDQEPGDDRRSVLVRVANLPGAVILAGPPDWDARQLHATLRDVAALPVKGYARLGTAGWRSMEDQRRVPPEEVARTARGADLLVLKGEVGDAARGARPRGLWRWPSGEGGETELAGDWYAVPSHGSSPLAAAWSGVAHEALPPLSPVTPIEPEPGEWVGLNAQLGRRGVERPVIVGRDSAGIRTVLFAADGFWRWAFRPGGSEEGYRQVMAGVTNWLLAAADTGAGAVRPIRRVVPLGIPIQFEWTGAGAALPRVIVFTGAEAARTDTLQFDGAGRAEVRLAPGRYAYQVQGGGRGVVAVERWSEEFVPRDARLLPHEAPPGAATTRSALRDRNWLYALIVLLLSVEWWLRRRMGLR